jgi:hypothetical protein
VNQVQIQLLNRLREIVDEYVSDVSAASKMKMNIEPSKVKYVLHELERNRTKPISAKDKEAIKDIYFNFC